MTPLNLPCPVCGCMCRVGTATWVPWLGSDGAWNIEGGVGHECETPGLDITIVRTDDGRVMAFGLARE